jgi:hypothetical protein
MQTHQSSKLASDFQSVLLNPCALAEFQEALEVLNYSSKKGGIFV